jgi:hypothetical protein
MQNGKVRQIQTITYAPNESKPLKKNRVTPTFTKQITINRQNLRFADPFL